MSGESHVTVSFKKNLDISISIPDLAGLRSSGKTNCFFPELTGVRLLWSRDVAQDARGTDRQAQHFLAFGKFLLAKRKVLKSLLFQEGAGGGKETQILGGFAPKVAFDKTKEVCL